jgi:hypothetical protein
MKEKKNNTKFVLLYFRLSVVTTSSQMARKGTVLFPQEGAKVKRSNLSDQNQQSRGRSREPLQQDLEVV